MTAPVAKLGILGVFLAMVPESACIPIPSEVTLMSAGFAAHQGWLSLPLAVCAATAGNICGSLLAYWAGRRGLLARLPLVGERGLASCEVLFERIGDRAVLFARLLPLARTFISLPAGDRGVPLPRFVAFTALGSWLWALAFVLAGDLSGGAWHELASIIGRVVLVASAGLVLTLLLRGLGRHLH
jgi:membrane protein DedA with SNARE-associated domain